MAWKACNKLTKIWKSTLSKNLKIKLFHATVESVLLYGCETWIIATKIRKALNGCYIQECYEQLYINVDWKTHMANKELYGDTSQITTKIKALTIAGHCKGAEGCIVSKLVTWGPTQGQEQDAKGRPKKTCVDLLVHDTGYAANEVENSMQDMTDVFGEPSSMSDSKSRRSESVA